ncbi:MAG: hypothetical protein OEU32_08870 [Acidimicrobiia bacterium]|nr:hypothetical protein [Acidimicrobiia bacterium]
MILAAVNDTPYDIVLFLHIVAVIISVGPVVAHPLLMLGEEQRGGDLQALAQKIVGLPTKVYMYAFIVAGILGIGLISMSDDVISWGDPWIYLSLVVWVGAMGLQHGLLFPAERALAEGDTAAADKVKLAGAVFAGLVLILVYFMVFKPGGGGL